MDGDGRKRFIDDAARVAEGAVSTLVGVRREVESMVRHRVERTLAGFDLVRREEFEVVREMAAAARAEQERLEERVAALEKALASKPKAAPRRRAKAAAAAKPAEDAAAKPAEEPTE